MACGDGVWRWRAAMACATGAHHVGLGQLVEGVEGGGPVAALDARAHGHVVRARARLELARTHALEQPQRHLRRCGGAEVGRCRGAEVRRCGRCGECAAGAAAPATASTRSSRRGRARVTPRRLRCAVPARSDRLRRAPPGEGAGLMVGVRRGWG
eukprot:scaffold57487_cov61-Phaeocystis_antarctica.AAC.1